MRFAGIAYMTLAVALACATLEAGAQQYPSKPIASSWAPRRAAART